MSTRKGGTSPEPLGMNLSYRVGDDRACVEENRRRFFGALGFASQSSAIPLQCHSDRIECVTGPGDYESCDGLITATPNLPLVITVADCLPVVLYDPMAGVVANVHAGWRGSVQGIVRKAVVLMQNQFGATPETIVAYLGPSAGVCCYEVGREVAEVFASEHHQVRGDKTYLDLKLANRDQLLRSGLKPGNIEVSAACTICASEIFHSYRRDRERSGRMMAVVSIVEAKGL
ncbi:MAG: peptidoglycan editing factor PgeF [Ignavibacteriales bacterium]|nr:peptidoglycan editing factor PgeF [Ignavibacteriales bacterium]